MIDLATTVHVINDNNIYHRFFFKNVNLKTWKCSCTTVKIDYVKICVCNPPDFSWVDEYVMGACTLSVKSNMPRLPKPFIL